MDNTIVYLCPDYISSTIKISKKNTQKGTYTGMSYYKGFNKYNVYGYFKDDEIATKIKEIKFEKNNFDTILHRPERKMRQNYLKNKNYQSFLLCYLINQIGGVKAPFFIGIRLHLTTSSLL